MALDTLAPINDLGAVNRLLAAAGESPLTALGSGRPDEAQAVAVLEEVSREVQQAERWKFNFRQTFEVAPAGTYDWLDSAGETTTLNIFKLPSSVLRWEVSPTSPQLELSLALGMSERYTEASEPVAVLLDTLRNRDGLPADKHPYLYLDLVVYTPWDILPETARAYIVRESTSRFVTEITEGKGPDMRKLEQESLKAWRTLVKDQRAPRTNNNLFDGPDHYAIRGRRRGHGLRWVEEARRR